MHGKPIFCSSQLEEKYRGSCVCMCIYWSGKACDSVTRVRLNGETEYFTIRVGVHKGSALSLYLFFIIIDKISKNIQDEALLCMLFSDYVVLVGDWISFRKWMYTRWRKALQLFYY